MNYLRLQRDGNVSSEFYIDEIQANYLSDIKDLNIIVGANNTRKSRFIRNLINVEFKVLIESPTDLNKLMHEADILFEGISDKIKQDRFIRFSFTHSAEESELNQQLRAYFQRQINTKDQVALFDLEKLISEIRKAIASVALEDQITKLTDQFSQTSSVIGAIKDIVLNVKQTGQYSFDTPNPSGIPGVQYNFMEFNQPHEPLINLELILNLLIKLDDWLTAIAELVIEPYHDSNLIYIPVLRASRKLEGNKTTIFKDTLQKQYKLTENNKLSIETGLDLYEKIEAARNGHRARREDFAAFEKFLSDIFFQSRSIDMIAVKGSDISNSHVMISIEGDNDDIAIHDLGDGIQAVIILLLPIFTAKKGTWIFIDEPENNLHPGFQNILIRAISENPTITGKGLRFFINTHSNHILSEALLGSAETEIFVFTRRDKDSTNISVFDGNGQHALEMLGVLNTSVLISNCTIWVEGITDRLYLRAFLKAYCQANKSKVEPIEGFQYSFIEYAGNNLIHYNFDPTKESDPDRLDEQINTFFINSNVFLLADSDFNKQAKHSYYEQLDKNKVNFTFHQTGLPEIENLLPRSVLQAWLTNSIGCEAAEIETVLNELKPTQKLGTSFHDKFTLKGSSKRKFMNEGDGGTLVSRYKNDLADFVHKSVSNGTITWHQLKESEMLEKLVIKLFNFINDKNRREIGKDKTMD
jgi:hypothetical protein